MLVGIAYSVNDPAGKGSAFKFIDLAKCREDRDFSRYPGAVSVYHCESIPAVVIGFKEDVLYFEFLNMYTEIDFFVVLSRHSSKTAIPALTVHTPGNPGPTADAGGKPWEVSTSNPVLMWLILRNELKFRKEYNLENFEVCYEVTHHGPSSIDKPITFAEIGSSYEQWTNTKAQEALAHAVYEALRTYLTLAPSNEICIVSVGFGGPHYAPTFTKRAIQYNECYGHMVPLYVLKTLTAEDIQRTAKLVIERTPKVKRVVIEKFRSELRKPIELSARSYGLEVIRV